MLIQGGCHCGQLTYELDWPDDRKPVPARACSCTYCTRFGGNWISDPNARLQIRATSPDAMSRYRFGTKTADFLFCSFCGVSIAAISRIGGKDYAVVNVNTFSEPVTLAQSRSDFDGESADDRLARRAQRWIAQVRYRLPSAD